MLFVRAGGGLLGMVVGCRPVWLSSSQLCVQKLRILIEDSDQNCKSLLPSLAVTPECHDWDSEISHLGDQMLLGPQPSAVLMPILLEGFVDRVVALTAVWLVSA